MNKKGFTLIEVMAVIIIISILLSLAGISYLKIRREADDKEKISLRQSVISSFDMYRINNGVSVNTNIYLKNLNSSFTYAGKMCNVGNSSTIKVVKKTTGSKQETYCLKLYCNDNLVIDDYSDDEQKAYCK